MPICWHRSIITLRPLLDLTQDVTSSRAGVLVDAWTHLHEAGRRSEAATRLDAYRYDLVDVSRQVMSNLFLDIYTLFQAAYARRDVGSVKSISRSLIELIEDWDELLATHKAYLLGDWIATARSWGTTEAESDLYEFNARNQVTLWGPKAEDAPTLWGYVNDYAAKNWAGLAKGYYLHRWELFTNFALEALEEGTERGFAFNAYAELEMAIGVRFCNDTETVFSPYPVGDSFEASFKMLKKYGSLYSSSKYTQIDGVDIDDESLDLVSVPAYTDNVSQLAFLCDADPACRGFSSLGLFKSNVGSPTPSANPRTTLYVKAE